MKSHLERLRELNEVSQNHPSVLPLIGAVLELEGKIQDLNQSKQDKRSVMAPADSNELTRGSLQGKLHKILSGAGTGEREVALKIHAFLSSLE